MEKLIHDFIDKNQFELFMLNTSGVFEIMQYQSQIYAAQKKNDPSFHCTIEDYNYGICWHSSAFWALLLSKAKTVLESTPQLQPPNC